MNRQTKAFLKVPRRRKRSAPVSVKRLAVNPASIELALLMWMSKENWSECEESRKRLSVLESEIAKHAAKGALESLLTAGCDRGALLRSLGLSCGKPVDFVLDNWFTKLGPQSLQGLFGMDGRDFSALKNSLLKASDRIDGINGRFEFGVLLTTSHLQMFQGIPSFLHGYVSLLDLAAKRLARGAHFYRNLGKGILTLYVKQQTGRFRDEEVSGLLAAVYDNEYGVINHRDWRNEQKEFFARLSPFIPLFHSRSAPQQ